MTLDPLGVRFAPPSPTVDLGAALDRIDEGFVVLDRDFVVRHANTAASTMVGRRVADLVGRDLWANFPLAVGTDFERCTRDAVETQRVAECEDYVETLGRWVSLRVYPAAGATTVVLRDVTHVRSLTAGHHGLLVRLLEAENRERARIAADVHDDSVQALGAVGINLQLLRRYLQEPSAEVEALQAILADLVKGATDRLRALLFTLEPTDASIPIARSIRIFASHIFDGSPIHWSVDDVDVGDELPPVERSQALRIVREAISNARQHAHPTEVIVTLRGDDEGLEIVVCDDGDALDPRSFVTAPGHRGLATMQDRATIVGGSCTMEPTSPHGCTVRVFVPRV